MVDQQKCSVFSLIEVLKLLHLMQDLQVVETKVDHATVLMEFRLIADFGRRPRIEFQAKATARDVG